MNMQKKRRDSIKLSISLPSAMAAWLRKTAEIKMTTVSALVKDALMPGFVKQQKKKPQPPQ